MRGNKQCRVRCSHVRLFASAIILLLVVLCTGSLPLASQAASPSWAGAWPMAGHDPQRTAYAPDVGPVHPHLLWAYRGVADQPLVGPDATIYSWSRGGLLALSGTGQRRWLVPAREFLGGPPVLGTDGLVRVSGVLPAPAGTSPQQVAIFAVAATGRRVWTLRALSWALVPGVPFSKGTSPLLSADNTLYLPFVGPMVRPGANLGVEVIAPSGVPLRHLLAGWAGSIALAHDGTVYAVGSDLSGHTAVLAVHPAGTLWWQHALPDQQPGRLLVSRQGLVVVSAGTGTGPGDSGEVSAFTLIGRPVWRLGAAGLAALAERADGVVLVADARAVRAVSSTGTLLWRRSLGRLPAASPASPPSLVVDAAGRAYIGSGEGVVRAIGPQGEVRWALNAGSSPRVPSADVPLLALGPGGVLAVTGTDGVLRVYR